MQVCGSRVVVVGLGRSGVAAAELLLARGARVIANDSAPRAEMSPRALLLGERGAELVLGAHPECIFADADFAVVSPGVPGFPALSAFEGAGREVLGELELASRFARVPIVLIGGTNGKSTTTALVGAMLAEGGEKAFVGGNFGTPASEAVGADHSVWVLESQAFRPSACPRCTPGRTRS